MINFLFISENVLLEECPAESDGCLFKRICILYSLSDGEKILSGHFLMSLLVISVI